MPLLFHRDGWTGFNNRDEEICLNIVVSKYKFFRATFYLNLTREYYSDPNYRRSDSLLFMPQSIFYANVFF